MTRFTGLDLRKWFKDEKRIDKANSFGDMAYNSIITNSTRSTLEGDIREKLKNDKAFQSWRKKILKQYLKNPLIKKYLSVVKFGGENFFSIHGETEVKLSVRNATVVASFSESNGAVNITYQLKDTFDLDYQPGRGGIYNGINSILKPIWVDGLGGSPGMQVSSSWSETLKK